MNERGISRGQFLRLVAGGALGAVFGTEFLPTPDMSDIKKALDVTQMGYEYGPSFARAIARSPIEFRKTVDLWREPDPSYRETPFFRTTLGYGPGDSRNVVVGFGDSNLLGSNSDKRNTPIALFTRKVTEKVPGLDWVSYNFARNGNTTKLVIEEQLLSDGVKQVFKEEDKCDVWVNAGGNDMAQLAGTREEFREAARLIEDPMKHPEILFKYAARMQDNLNQFRDNFSMLLRVLGENYGSQIRHLVIVSLPDLSLAPSITSQSFGDEIFRLPINERHINDLMRKVSLRLNNEMFRAVSEFHERTGITTVGIDTFNINGRAKIFGEDQHYTIEADHAIADNAVSRASFVGLAA